MYHQVKTDESAWTVGGSQFKPVATLADGYGGRVQIAIDDHCYVLYLRKKKECPEGCLDVDIGKYVMVHHWFREAWEVLRGLPPPV